MGKLYSHWCNIHYSIFALYVSNFINYVKQEVDIYTLYRCLTNIFAHREMVDFKSLSATKKFCLRWYNIHYITHCGIVYVNNWRRGGDKPPPPLHNYHFIFLLPFSQKIKAYEGYLFLVQCHLMNSLIRRDHHHGLTQRCCSPSNSPLSSYLWKNL